MKRNKILLASALAASVWCTAPQAQTLLYGVESPVSSTGASPSVENTSAYPKHPGTAGYAVTEYWENGMRWQRRDPVVVDSAGNASYVYPESARLGVPPVIRTMPSNPNYDTAPRYPMRVE